MHAAIAEDPLNPAVKIRQSTHSLQVADEKNKIHGSPSVADIQLDEGEDDFMDTYLAVNMDVKVKETSPTSPSKAK